MDAAIFCLVLFGLLLHIFWYSPLPVVAAFAYHALYCYFVENTLCFSSFFNLTSNFLTSLYKLFPNATQLLQNFSCKIDLATYLRKLDKSRLVHIQQKWVDRNNTRMSELSEMIAVSFVG